MSKKGYIYQALDNNGDLICLTTDKQFAVKTADSHFKDTAASPILGDEWPDDTEVVNSKGETIGTLGELLSPT